MIYCRVIDLVVGLNDNAWPYVGSTNNIQQNLPKWAYNSINHEIIHIVFTPSTTPASMRRPYDEDTLSMTFNLEVISPLSIVADHSPPHEQ